MNFGKTRNLTLAISEFLEVNALFEILRTTLENLMQNLMLGYFLAILHLVKPIEFSTKRQWS